MAVLRNMTWMFALRVLSPVSFLEATAYEGIIYKKSLLSRKSIVDKLKKSHSARSR